MAKLRLNVLQAIDNTTACTKVLKNSCSHGHREFHTQYHGRHWLLRLKFMLGNTMYIQFYLGLNAILSFIALGIRYIKSILVIFSGP